MRTITLAVVTLTTLTALAASAQPLRRIEKGEKVPLAKENILFMSVAELPVAQESQTISSTTSGISTIQALGLDDNEATKEIASAYIESRKLIVQGQWDKARRLLRQSIERFPSSRHLHQKLAELEWAIYKDRQEGVALSRAKQESLRAVELGLSRGIYHGLTLSILAESLGELGDGATLEHVFGRIIGREPSANHYLYFARGLRLLEDPRAEAMFREAANRRPEDGLPELAEWLLDHGREGEVLEVIPSDTREYYLHFLRGLAYERLGSTDSARNEYKQFAEFSTIFPAPSRFKIPASVLQEQSGIRFQDSALYRNSDYGGLRSIASPVTATQTIDGLARLISGEAPDETRGGRRAAGWIVRSRTLRGAVVSGGQYCPGATNQGATLADKYKSVMCYGIGTTGEQFNGMCDPWCSNPSTSSCLPLSGTTTTAYNVYYGYEPDPVSGHCPGGTTAGSNYCSDTIQCFGYLDTYRLAGPLFNYGTPNSCPTDPPASGCTVTELAGKTCGNGSWDNCFFYHQAYGTTSSKIYSCTLPATGYYCSSSTIYTSGGIFKGHLEGPDGSKTTPDFDLYLQRFNGATGQWENVGQPSMRWSSIEDFEYSASAGTYRWLAYSYNGSGLLVLHAKEP